MTAFAAKFTTPAQRPILRDAAIIFGVAWFVIGWFVLRYDFDFLTDARAYYNGSVQPYEGIVGTKGVFTYLPPLAQAFAFLRVIPEPLFLGCWLSLNIGVALWLLRGQWAAGLMLAMPLSDAIVSGQIEIMMAAAVVLGRPGAWALPLLSKSTTGVGLLWYAARREWRALAIALGLTAAICAVSFALSPSLWATWWEFIILHARTAGQALPLRLGIALVVVAWGARKGRYWTVPLAVTIALPVLYVHSLVMLLGVGAVRARRKGGLLAPATQLTARTAPTS